MTHEPTDAEVDDAIANAGSRMQEALLASVIGAWPLRHKPVPRTVAEEISCVEHEHCRSRRKLMQRTMRRHLRGADRPSCLDKLEAESDKWDVSTLDVIREGMHHGLSREEATQGAAEAMAPRRGSHSANEP